MNVEEVMKKLEEIKVELYNNVTSSEDKSPVQVERMLLVLVNYRIN